MAECPRAVIQFILKLKLILISSNTDALTNILLTTF